MLDAFPALAGFVEKNHKLIITFCAKEKAELALDSSMAGAVGFEPTVDGTKNRCLTAWPRPIEMFVIAILDLKYFSLQ